MKPPVIIHYNARFLPITEIWIYNQLIHLECENIFLCRHRMNNDLFPLDNVYSLSDIPIWEKYWNILCLKIIGFMPYFHQLAKGADLIHIHFGHNAPKSIGLKRKLDIPMVCTFYGSDAFRWTKENPRKLKKVFANCDMILAVGHYMRDYLIGLGCPKEKIIVNHLGVDIKKVPFKKRQFYNDSKIKFLINSSFVEKKGYDIALKALAGTDLDFTLDIIGRGPLENMIMDTIKELGIIDRVTFHGHVPYNYVIELCLQCHVLLQASKTSAKNDKEGVPISIVDAMATGMPVVSTKHSDIPDIVIDGYNGILAKENDVEDFRRAILTMVNMITREFSQRCREIVEKNFNIEIQSYKLRKIYEKLR